MAARPQPFDRETIGKAFERLGELAVAAGKIVEISVYGGSALVLTLEARPATTDVDAVFDRDRTFVRNAAQAIAAEFDWEENWLNDGVKGFLSAADSELDAKRLMFTYPSDDHPGLRVFVASPPYLFAMKSLAMRTGGAEEKRDIDDIRRLGVVLGVQNAAQALAIVSRYYPSERLPPKTRFGLEENLWACRFMKRPRSIAEIAERAAAGVQAFDPAVREFIDAWQLMSMEERQTAVAGEPVLLGGVKDAYLGAVAEYLMGRERKFAPAWTENAERFLSEPFFAGGLDSLKAILIVESPSAFRRRLIFISADGLSRPHHAMSP